MFAGEGCWGHRVLLSVSEDTHLLVWLLVISPSLRASSVATTELCEWECDKLSSVSGSLRLRFLALEDILGVSWNYCKAP